MKKIPTNIITGFLGVGKTTAILNLLAHKPADESWGVLVNEFGDIGIDATMIEGHGATVAEIPGGCMCCVAGLPMQVGLNRLIKQAKPDRLIIEPTGLGHPKRIIDTLTNEYYGEQLELCATITLVDPRNLHRQRYLDNENFRDQIELADIVVANKADLCTELDKEEFEKKLSTYHPKKQVLGWVELGNIELNWLTYPRLDRKTTAYSLSHKHPTTDTSSLSSTEQKSAQTNTQVEARPFIRKENSGQSFFSCGWVFDRHLQFDYLQLSTYLSQLNIERIKALVRTDNGVFIFNSVNGALSINASTQEANTRIEFIDSKSQLWNEIEKQLMSMLIS